MCGKVQQSVLRWPVLSNVPPEVNHSLCNKLKAHDSDLYGRKHASIFKEICRIPFCQRKETSLWFLQLLALRKCEKIKQSLVYVCPVFGFAIRKTAETPKELQNKHLGGLQWIQHDTTNSGPKYFSHLSCSWGATGPSVFRSSLQPHGPCQDHDTRSLARIPRSKGFVEQLARGMICLAIIPQLQKKPPGLLQHRYLLHATRMKDRFEELSPHTPSRCHFL